MNFIQKVFPFPVCAQGYYVHVLNAQLFTAHWDYYAIIRFTSAAFAPRLTVSAPVIIQIKINEKAHF